MKYFLILVFSFLQSANCNANQKKLTDLDSPKSNEYITFTENGVWEVSFYENGMAEIITNNLSYAMTQKGKFNLYKIYSEIGPMITIDPKLSQGVQVFTNLGAETNPKPIRYYGKNILYFQQLFRKVLRGVDTFPVGLDRVRSFLYEYPPMGLDDLELEDLQLRENLDHTGKPFHWEKRKPKSLLPEWSKVTQRITQRITQRFPVVVEVSAVAGLLFSTPWPYLALGCLLALGLRRYRLNKSAANTAAPEAL